MMLLNFSDKIRVDYKGYMEPLLLTACNHIASKIGCRTRSKYIRYAVIKSLIQDGYPLNKYSSKFDKFYNKINNLNKGITT
jgi:hypothetical protein